MEARRLEVRGQIEKRMKEEDLDNYTLEQGFADIMRYQMATTLDGAIQEITASASAKEDDAQEAYRDATASCRSPKAIRTQWGAIDKRAYDLRRLESWLSCKRSPWRLGHRKKMTQPSRQAKLLVPQRAPAPLRKQMHSLPKCQQSKGSMMHVRHNDLV